LVGDFRSASEPDILLYNHLHLFTPELKPYPVLDLACGDGHNGIFLAKEGFQVIFADRSEEALAQVRDRLEAEGMAATLWHVDLEMKDAAPLSGRTFSAVLVFRYLHRPLIPAIREALMPGGILVYETFTAAQAQFGKPKNPDHLLKAGELPSLFRDWEVIHAFEGITGEPPKAIAQLVCRKPQG
jgi:SAM-dependent methyltransferase